MTLSLRSLLPAVYLALAAAAITTAASAQIPTPPTAGTPPPGPRPAPTNLKALPKDTTNEQIAAYMREYEGALGVGCSYCHAPRDPITNRGDRASDANPVKDRTRVMIKMTADINAEYLTKLTDPKPENPVTCGTCHRGMAHPALFVPKPQERAPAPPAATPPPATPR
jgi:hypothetical protein